MSLAFLIGPGYSPTGFFWSLVSNGTISTLPTIQSDVPILGTGGRILAVWYVMLSIISSGCLTIDCRTCLSIAIFQFIGGEMVLVTAAEAESPRRDLPVAARYMYLLPVSLYLIGILLVGLCIDYLDPLLPHQHVPQPSTSNPRFIGITTAARSPFVIAIQAAGITVLPSFLNAAFLFSALTAALVSSRYM